MRSTNELETVVAIITANDRQMRRGDALRPYMEIITSEMGEEGETGLSGPHTCLHISYHICSPPP